MINSKVDVSISAMQTREVDILTFASLTPDLLFPEKLVIRFDDEKTSVDLGILCYAKREKLAFDYSKHKRIYGLVDPNSLIKERKELIRGLVDVFLRKMYRPSSALSKLGDITRVINWADMNSHQDFLAGIDQATQFYQAYSDHLHHRVLVLDNLEPRSAADYQRTAVFILGVFFGQEDVKYIVRRVTNIVSQKGSGIESPGEVLVSRYVNVVSTLAKDLSRQLMEDKQFPFHLKFHDFETYIFQGRGCNVKTPYSPEPFAVYNFEEGRIATVEEHYDRVAYKNLNVSKKAVNDAEKTLLECNDRFSESRVRYIVCALQCYAVLFQMITGVNPSQLIELEFAEALEIVRSPIKREFSAVKFRASGKKINIAIGDAVGVKFLKEYLNFRAWVLKDKSFNLLFFEFARYGRYTDEPQKLRLTFQSKLFGTKLRGLFLPKNFKNLPPSMMRIHKSVIMHELGLSPKLVAESLQHSEKTNLKHYAEISTQKQSLEFQKFWKSVNKAAQKYRIIDESDSHENIIPTVTGLCDEFGSPDAISENVPIQPNCNTQYGCLYCEHYCCHADRADVHKLLSLKYVFLEVRRFSKDISHSDNLLREICVRASFIIDKISAISEDHKLMVTDVEKQVFDLGILTPFWESRLSNYERLGIVV